MVVPALMRGVLRPGLSIIVLLCINVCSALAIRYTRPSVKNDTFGDDKLRSFFHATRNSTQMITIQDAAFALEDLQHRYGNRFKFFAIIAPHRSGSTFLSSLLKSHPEIQVFREEFQCHPNHNDGCKNNETLEETFDRLSNKLLDANVTRIGFKLMQDQLQNVAGKVFQHIPINVTFIVHFRRNILRRIISGAKGQNCGADGPGCMHPVSKSIAKKLRLYKPSLDATNLISKIQSRFQQQREVMDALRNISLFNPKCISHYEDWLNPKTRSDQTRNIETCLGVPNFKLASEMKPIHQALPILTTISNGQEVKNTLFGTKFESMLEDAKSTTVVYENLKMYDAFDNSHVELSGDQTHVHSRYPHKHDALNLRA